MIPLERPNGDIVLIVDDVPENLSLLHDALDEVGFSVLVATGEAALGLARQHAPAVILLDAVMPGMDGCEVARRLKADPATQPIPIVFMSGLTDTEQIVAAFRLTAREAEVLYWVSKGKTNRDIGERGCQADRM